MSTSQDQSIANLVPEIINALRARTAEVRQAHQQLTDELTQLARAEAALQRLRSMTALHTTAGAAGGNVTIGSPEGDRLDRVVTAAGTNYVITIREGGPPHPARRRRRRTNLAPNSSTARVAELVKELGTSAVEEIYEEFAGRGWLDPTWTRPQDAVAQAARRAADQGLIQKLDDKRYAPAQQVIVLPDSATSGTGSAEGERVVDLRDGARTPAPTGTSSSGHCATSVDGSDASESEDDELSTVIELPNDDSTAARRP